MSKIEKQIKKYYLDSFKHASQLNNIKSRADLNEKTTFNFTKVFKFGMGLSIGFASIFGAIVIANSLKTSNDNIIPMTQRIEKAVIQINNGPDVTFTVNENGVVDSIYGNDDDGKLLIYGLDLLNKPYEDVIKTIIDEEIACGYLLKEEKYKKYNNLSFKVYDDNSNIDEGEFAQSINSYLTKKSISLNDEIEVEVEEEYESVYPFDGVNFDSFNEFYEELKKYYLDQGDAVSDIVEEFDLLMYYYSSRLAYFETLLEGSDEKVKELINNLSVGINNYLKGFYDLFIGVDSSYQNLYKDLLNEKVNLLINRVDEDFDYDAETSKVEKKIASLESFKEFFMEEGLKPKLDKLNKGLNAILEYIGNTSFEEVDEELLSKKIDEKQKSFNSLFDKNALIKDLLKIKKDLKNYFR